MTKLLALLISLTCGFQSVLLVGGLFSMARQSIAHQITATESVGATIHLDPNDSPHARQPSLTWFLLTQPNGEIISPASCDCEVTVYNSFKQVIAEDLPFTPLTLEGHQTEGHQAISTHINFPDPGNYLVVLSGQALDASFEPFVLEFPVIVRP